MISRFKIECAACGGKGTLRAVAPYNTNPELFLFPCPHCSVALLGRMDGVVGITGGERKISAIKISSSDFSILDEPSFYGDGDDIIVTVATDIPIHRTLHVKSLNDGGSPALWFAQQMPKGYLQYQAIASLLNEMRTGTWPVAKRMISYAEQYDWDRVLSTMGPLKPEPGDTLSNHSPVYVFYRSIEACFFHLLVEPKEMVSVKTEYFEILNNLLINDEIRYRSLLEAFVKTHAFGDYRNKVLKTVSRLSNHYSSIVLGIFYDKASNQVRSSIDDYRVSQADYDSIKSLYVDIFELINRMLLYVGMAANLNNRSDPNLFLPIQIKNKTKQLTSPSGFRQLAAFEKLKILAELPKLQSFFSAVSRPMRNDIGHFNAQYDFRTGNLIYEDGSSVNYIVFLNQLLEAVRAIWFLVGVNEKIEIDLDKFNID